MTATMMGMMTATRSDSGALLTSTTTSTTAVIAAPTALMPRRQRQPLTAVAQPVADHAPLAQGEGHEDADGVERDERVGVAVEGDEQQCRDRGAGR